jgi:hypothetical protein
VHDHPTLGPYGNWVRHAVAEGELYPPVDPPGLSGDDRTTQESAFAHLDRWLRVPIT